MPGRKAEAVQPDWWVPVDARYLEPQMSNAPIPLTFHIESASFYDNVNMNLENSQHTKHWEKEEERIL